MSKHRHTWTWAEPLGGSGFPIVHFCKDCGQRKPPAEPRARQVSKGRTALVADVVNAAEDALRWISEECKPHAEWAAEGHNVSMSGADRQKGCRVMADLDDALNALSAFDEPSASAERHLFTSMIERGE